MDRKKKLPKDCDIFFFTVYSRNHVPELSYFFKGLFQKGLWEEILRLRIPWGYNVLGRGFFVSIFFIVTSIDHLLDGVILLLQLEFFTFFLSYLILAISARFKQQKH